MGPIKGIGKNYNAVMVSFMAIERVMEILDLQPAIADKPSAQKLKADIMTFASKMFILSISRVFRF